MAHNTTFIAKTTKLLKGKVTPSKAATALHNAAARVFRSIPDEYIKTLTADSGKEFAGHKELSRKWGCAIYFAHPRHSHGSGGLNERANGLIRQYLSKGAAFEWLA
jgi:IS30 family transposase